MKKFWIRSWKETEGQNLVEYALIVAVIALGMIPVVESVRSALSRLYLQVSVISSEPQITPQQPREVRPTTSARDSSGPEHPIDDGLSGMLYRVILYFFDFLMALTLVVFALILFRELRASPQLESHRSLNVGLNNHDRTGDQK